MQKKKQKLKGLLMPNKQLKMRNSDWSKRKLHPNKQLLMRKLNSNRMLQMLKLDKMLRLGIYLLTMI